MDEDEKCPKCGEECYRDSVDVGVGVIYGPWGCPACGWSSSLGYDHSDGKVPAKQAEHPDYYVDQFGGMTPKKVLMDAVARFGIDPGVFCEVFP